MIESISFTLVLFLALAVIEELGLTMIFQDKRYKKHLAGKGFKKPIAIVAGLFICAFYKLDIFVMLMGGGEPTVVGIVAGAFTIAGGSDGVLNMGRKLGVRTPK